MSDSPSAPSLDRASLVRLYQAGTLRPRDVLSMVLQRLDAYADPAVWIFRLPAEQVLARTRALEERQKAGACLPLYGLPFAVKDNIDVAGCPTTAACPDFAYVPPRSSPAVERLEQAGAICVGKTNLDQFACGLAGDRSPYGACRNVFSSDHVSGGSSSGSAVAVAAGLVSFALGTDTAGSGRVPAGCNNIVGLKPTLGLLSTEGVVPASQSLDCVTFLALTAADARAACEVVLDGRWPMPSVEDELGEGVTFAVPRDEDLEFFGDADQERLFRQAVSRLEQLGARRVAVDFRPFREVASLLYEGPWLAERWAALRDFVKAHPDALLSVIRSVVEDGARYSAADLFRARHRLDELRRTCGQTFELADLLVVPTMPTVPTSADVQLDSRLWGRRLGHYTNFVNLLGLAAIALPAGFTPGGLPGGITLIGPAGSDRWLCDLGTAWQRRLQLPLGATGHPFPESERSKPARPAEGHVRLAVAGAHLRGQPLHQELRRAGACLVRTCHTAARYRFVALMHLDPPRPGLVRDSTRAGAVRVEIYDLPLAGFGQVVAAVAPPLAIGTIELEDGEAVKGYLCESWAAVEARDITDFGGWVAFRDHLEKSTRATASRLQPRE